MNVSEIKIEMENNVKKGRGLRRWDTQQTNTNWEKLEKLGKQKTGKTGKTGKIFLHLYHPADNIKTQ